MSLPKNCLYTNKINSSYARNFMSVIQPQNGDANLGDTIIFNVPTGNNLVMSGADTVLKFTLTLKGGSTQHAQNTVKLNKCGAYGCFQRLRVFHSGALISDIDNYANLMDMLIPIQQSSDGVASKYNILAGTDVGGGASFNPSGAIAVASEGTSQSYCLPFMSILSLTNNYVPLFSMNGSPLRIELQIVSAVTQLCKSIDPIVAPTTAPLLSKIELVCNMVELSDTGMSIIKNSIGSGPLQWVTQDYRNYGYNVTLGTSETMLSVPVPAKFNSLTSLFFSFRQNAAGVAKNQALESCKFKLSEYFLRIGSKTMPVKPPNSTAEFFSELLRSFGTVSDINQECSVSLAQYSRDKPVDMAGAEGAGASVTGSFYIGIDLESYSNTSMSEVYTGTNTSTDDIFFVPKFAGQDANTNIRIDAYALYDQLILIQNGVCTVNN